MHETCAGEMSAAMHVGRATIREMTSGEGFGPMCTVGMMTEQELFLVEK